HWLVRRAGLDAETYGNRIREFAATYKAGRFDIEGYLTFQMDLLARFPRPQLEAWRDAFVREHVAPHVRAEAKELIASRRTDGYVLALVTGTHAFLTRAIADLFGIEHLLAVMPEEVDGKFTGRYVGTHTYQEGKVRAVHGFLAARGTTLAACED